MAGATIALTLLLGNTATAQGPNSPFVGFPGDFNRDGSVDEYDWYILVDNFGESTSSNLEGDLAANGVVDTADFNVFIFFFLGTENVMPCDANGDGEVDILGDAFLIVHNLGTELNDNFEQNFRAGDINSDQVVDDRDLELLLEHLEDLEDL